MQIRSVRALRGPNIWSVQPCLEAIVDLGILKDISSEMIEGFNDRLMGWLPGLIEHRCSIGERGGFHIRLRRGTYLAHILEHTTIELQTLVGTPVGFGRARETSVEGVYKVAIRYAEESVGLACLEVAKKLCLAAVYNHPFDLPLELKPVRELANRVCLGPSTRAIVEAAKARGIPYQRLNIDSLVQLGQGHKQRRILTAETDFTSAIAESIAQDKELTKSLLRTAGVPVPEGREVESPEDAWAVAKSIDAPVVVKPLDGNHGRGVIMNLHTEDDVKRAYEAAMKEGSGVLVERFASGSEHRLLVVGGNLVAASRGDAAVIEGDGKHTAAELIDLQVNSDPRRGPDEICPLNKVLVTDPVVHMELKRQGYTPESVVPLGEKLIARRNDNLSIDVTDQVHPINAEHAVMAAKVVGLDIAGIDLVASDISIPLEDQGGVIVEVNAGPGLLMHLQPKVGQPRPVGEAIIESLFPKGETGRVPIVCVTGTNGKTTTCRIIASILAQTGKTIGVATSDGIRVGGRSLREGDCAGPRSARDVLLNPAVEAAVFEAGRGGILREGLGFDHCDVAVVTNIGEADHLGGYDIQTAEKMYTVKRTPVDVVSKDGQAVLNADDPLVSEMAALSTGGVTLFSRNSANPLIVRQRSEGKRAIYLRDGLLTVAEGGLETSLIAIADIPCTHGGRVPFQIDNVLAAVGATWGLKISFPTIIAGLQLFKGNLLDDPGRFNVYELGGKTLVLVHAWNASSLRALAEAIPAFQRNRSLFVYTVEPETRSQDVEAQAAILGEAADHVFVYGVETPSGTEDNESGAVRLLRQLQRSEHFSAKGLTSHDAWTEAVDDAWKEFSSEDLMVIQVQNPSEASKKVSTLLGLD